MKSQQESTDDWLQTLFAKRRRGRRISADLLPPYVTVDGMVTVDRRSHCDRRKALDQKLSTAPATN